MQYLKSLLPGVVIINNRQVGPVDAVGFEDEVMDSEFVKGAIQRREVEIVSEPLAPTISQEKTDEEERIKASHPEPSQPKEIEASGPPGGFHSDIPGLPPSSEQMRLQQAESNRQNGIPNPTSSNPSSSEQTRLQQEQHNTAPINHQNEVPGLVASPAGTTYLKSLTSTAVIVNGVSVGKTPVPFSSEDLNSPGIKHALKNKEVEIVTGPKK